jgi:hypothetical protein
MNCKPGDLAVVIHAPEEFRECTGGMLRVLRDSGVRHEGIVYWCYEPLSPAMEAFHAAYPEDVLCDAFLRPIRDPGDESVDETLLRNAIPQLESV